MNRLKELRNTSKILQKDMAVLLGVTERHYRLCETGKVDLPCSKLIILADFYKVSIDYLVGRSNDPNIHKQTEK